ncbi:hemocyanin isoform X1 [Hyalella azteca]|nr:hemocyanin isoform X1 [Hyalella azteca]
MKCLVVIVLFSSVWAWPSDFSEYDGPSFAQRQQDINRLLYKVDDILQFAELKEVADNFDPEADLSSYSDGGEAVKHLLTELRDHRLLKKHHWFSLFNKRQREEALILFDVFMHCKTWQATINNAAFFRERMNEGEFVYAIYAALVHTDLGRGIVLPPLYEVTPHLFANSEVIHKAYTAQMTRTPGKFQMEFTGSKKNPEQRVAYFGEDIGLNTHHVTWHLDFPFWWDDIYGYHLDRKGELFFWAHHQLTVRFDIERLSNHLNFVDELYWDKPIREGFAPHTAYRYGGEFPARPDNVEFTDVTGLVRVRDMIIYESRIRDAIALGYITAADGSHINIRDEHGIDHLGNIIESSAYSPNLEYYGALHNEAHILLGRQGDPKGKFKLQPGVMEHFETATRDPAFFRLHKHIDNIFKEHKDTLPPYTKEQLEFTGVVLDEIVVNGPLETYFEDFEFSLINAVDHNPEFGEVDVSAVVKRLNHKPFNLNIEITNENVDNKHAVVRVYLCPTTDANGVELSLEKARWNCIELDKFWTKLIPGSNSISRASSEASTTVPDTPSFKSLIAAVDEAVDAGTEVHLEEFDRGCGIPNRLLLPKGREEGLGMILIVGVTDAEEDALHEVLEDAEAHSHAQCGVHGEKYPDHLPMGFPLDRRIDDPRIFMSCTNYKKTHVTVTHIGNF